MDQTHKSNNLSTKQEILSDLSNEEQNKQHKPQNFIKQYFQLQNEIWDPPMWQSTAYRGRFNTRVYGGSSESTKQDVSITK